MVLDVGVHDGSEVVETAVPEQVNDEHLNTHVYEDVMPLSSAESNNTSFHLTFPTSDWKTSGPYLSVFSSKRQKSVSRTSRKNCEEKRNNSQHNHHIKGFAGS